MKESTATLHVFCDTLKDAYGAVAYITIQPGNSVSFMMAKCHVTLCSAALWSIPWKEMIGAVEAADLAVITVKALSLTLHELHMMTGSMTMLNWIINPAIRPTYFIR